MKLLSLPLTQIKKEYDGYIELSCNTKDGRYPSIGSSVQDLYYEFEWSKTLNS